MNTKFKDDVAVCDYYLEVEIENSDTFSDDLSKIRRYSKCRNRLKGKLVNIIQENTSSIQCQVYHVEMIGSGCNIHIIHI